MDKLYPKDVRPKVIDDVLVNPGIGFMTFQRFNGDSLNSGKRWTEGFPIDYQDFDGSLENEGYPMTSIAYFRVYWRFLEPEKGQYRWELVDRALETARSRKQSLMLRVAPYGTDDDTDVPEWYRQLVGDQKKFADEKWMVDPEDPRYAEYFGGFIREFGIRYDGHPDIESIDLSIVGAWGEGSGSWRLTEITRHSLIDAYIDTFKKTPLVMLLADEASSSYTLARADAGWRADCLGDMKSPLGEDHPYWCHMLDYYPQKIIMNGLQDAWKKAPVTMEVCWVVQHWKDMGWDIDYIIDQSLKWHISSFNAKSSAVPEDCWPQINRWLKKMGYRYALRKFSYPQVLKPGKAMTFTSWWENLGVAPCYKDFKLALRLSSDKYSEVFVTDADIKSWLPGDSLYKGGISIPGHVPPGTYQLDLGIIDPVTGEARIQLAIEGRKEDGWYGLGTAEVQLELEPPIIDFDMEPPW